MADELDDTPSAESVLLPELAKEQEEAKAEAGGPIRASYPPVEQPTSASQRIYDPGRRAGDPFKYSRDLRLQAGVLFPHSQELQQEYLERGNQQIASQALHLDEQLFDPDKGFLTKSPVNYSWNLLNLAKEEEADRKKFAELHGKKMKLIAGHQAELAGFEKENLGLQLGALQHQVDFSDAMSKSLGNQLEQAEMLQMKYQPLEDKFMTLMERIYTGMDHALEGGTIFDTVDTTTEYNPSTEQWETREDASASGIAAVSVASLGIIANFALTIASEGKVPMIADRLVFGIAENSLKKQKEKIEKYRHAGKAINTLYGTLLGQLESERAADSAYFAAINKRLEFDFTKKAAGAESEVMKNAYLIAAERTKIQREKDEVVSLQALQSHAIQLRNAERQHLANASQSQSQWRSDEAKRLEGLRMRVSPPDEMASERNLDLKTKIFTQAERKNVSDFTVSMDYFTKALVLIEELENKYGTEEVGPGSALINKIKRSVNVKYTELLGPMTPEYALSHFGKMSAQKHGRANDSANLAVQEMLHWIAMFYEGTEDLSTVKFKIAGFLGDQLKAQSQNYNLYKRSGNPKAIVLGEALMGATNKVYENADELAEIVMDPETSGDAWRDYFFRATTDERLIEGFRGNLYKELNRPLTGDGARW